MKKTLFLLLCIFYSLIGFSQTRNNEVLNKVVADFKIQNIDSLYYRLKTVNSDIKQKGIINFPEENAFLFRLNKITLPRFVIEILEDTNITKVGVALRDDLNGLKKIMPFNPQGFIDLQQFVKHYGIEDNGLKKLVANILGFRISKRYQTSNWEQELLETDQLTYAATDAWVCRQIYTELNNHHPSSE